MLVQNICLGSFIMFFVEGEWVVVQWLNGVIINVIIVSEQGGYGVVVMDSLGCMVNVVIVVFVFVVDVFEIDGDIGFCLFGEVIFVVEEGYVIY